MNRSFFACALTSLLVGCDGELLPLEARPFDEETLIARLKTYRQDGFTKVNKTAFKSAVADAWIEVFAAEGSLPHYMEIEPADASSSAEFPVGGLVVREVLDQEGQLTKITAVSKGPKGYNPAVGDLWFAVADKNGNILPDTTGAPQVGLMPACHGCHMGRKDNAFLFGVPMEMR